MNENLIKRLALTNNMKKNRKKMIYGLIILALIICLANLILNGLEITGNPVVLWKVDNTPRSSEPLPILCTDSDGGLSLYTKGTCSYKVGVNYKSTSQKTDYCKSGYVLVEFYCSNGRDCLAKEYTCSDACISGACMAPSKIQRTK